MPVLVAGLLTLAVSALRLYGERHDWDPTWFAKAAGGGGGLMGIAFLVPVFGFWFGRRLASGGNRPAHAGKAALWCLLGFGLVFGVFAFVQRVLTEPMQQVWVMGIATPLVGLCALKAWRSAWFVCVLYGFLARLPVVAIQHQAIASGWDVHYAKGPPNVPADVVEVMLTVAQLTFWPLAFTPIVGGLFAALGAMTVRRGN